MAGGVLGSIAGWAAITAAGVAPVAPGVTSPSTVWGRDSVVVTKLGTPNRGLVGDGRFYAWVRQRESAGRPAAPVGGVRQSRDLPVSFTPSPHATGTMP